MKVTKIQQQVKRRDRYSIYFDGIYKFSLSDYQLVGSGIMLGKEFTEQQLSSFIAESNFGKAYERALNYVMIRPRSEKEVRDYLVRTFLFPKPKIYVDKSGERHVKKAVVDKPEVEAMISRVMSRLDEKGYINDEGFAKAWIRSRQLTKQSSKRKLEQELRAKGIASDIIATLLQNNNETERENLKILIAKKQRLARYQNTEKLTRYLIGQGFRYDDIKDELHTTTF
jgi:regulatory protein